jgi:hypothetical protein
LIAPAIPEAAEKRLMKMKMNSYGKTWHVWNTGAFGMTADAMPLGEPHLAWSFNHDGEARAGLVEQRDARMDVTTARKRQDRRELTNLAKPQPGVEAISSRFKGPLQSIPGVSDAASGSR